MAADLKAEKALLKELKIKELTLQLEKLEREYDEVLAKSELTHENILNYIDDPDNFSLPIWERLQTERKKLDVKLDLAEKNVKDPKKLIKAFSERASIQPHWLFVR